MRKSKLRQSHSSIVLPSKDPTFTDSLPLPKLSYLLDSCYYICLNSFERNFYMNIFIRFQLPSWPGQLNICSQQKLDVFISMSDDNSHFLSCFYLSNFWLKYFTSLPIYVFIYLLIETRSHFFGSKWAFPFYYFFYF